MNLAEKLSYYAMLITALIMLPRFVYQIMLIHNIIHKHMWPCGLLGNTLLGHQHLIHKHNGCHVPASNLTYLECPLMLDNCPLCRPETDPVTVL